MDYQPLVIFSIVILMLVTTSMASLNESDYEECNTVNVKKFYTSSGSLSKPPDTDFYGMLGGSTCKWQVIGDNTEYVVYINVSQLSVLEGNCAQDYLRIANPISSVTWFDSCKPIASSTLVGGDTNSALIEFSTTQSLADTQLTLSWWYDEVCRGGPYNYDTFPGEFSSPQFSTFGGFEDCTYQVTASPNAYIQMTINFNTPTPACDTGYLKIVNAENPSEVWYNFCLFQVNKVIKTAGVSALVTFHKGDQSSFHVSYESTDKRGMTLVERQSLIAGGVVGGVLIFGIFIVIGCLMKVRAGKKQQQVSDDLEARKKSKQSKKVLPHIMISYQWDVKKEVLKFKEKLEKAGYRVWIDVEQMHKSTDTYDAMTFAVDNAAVVVPILTTKYQESVNCRKELQFADRSGKAILPVRLEKKFKPTKWLGFVIGTTLWHDLSDPATYEEQFAKLLESIYGIGKAAEIDKEQGKEKEDDAQSHEDSYAHDMD